MSKELVNKFDVVSNFENGVAKAKFNGGRVLINEQLEIISKQYYYIYDYSIYDEKNNRYFLASDNTNDVIEIMVDFKTGKELIAGVRINPINKNHIVVVDKENKVKLYNFSGHVLINDLNNIYENNGVYINSIISDDIIKYGILNKSSLNEIILPIYTSIKYVSDGIFLLKNYDKNVLFNINDKQYTKIIDGPIKLFKKCIIVLNNNKLKVVYKNGTTNNIISKYSKCNIISCDELNKSFLVVYDSKMNIRNIYDEDFNCIISGKFEDIYDCDSEGHILLRSYTDNGLKFGIIDYTGKILSPFIFEQLYLGRDD